MLVRCICRNIYCAHGKQYLHSKWNFISTFTEFTCGHGDERWPTPTTRSTLVHIRSFAFATRKRRENRLASLPCGPRRLRIPQIFRPVLWSSATRRKQEHGKVYRRLSFIGQRITITVSQNWTNGNEERELFRRFPRSFGPNHNS